MTGKEILKDVPVLTDENCEDVLRVYEKQYRKAYFEELKDCVEVLKKKYKGVVNGLWYVNEIDFDGGPYFIGRTQTEVVDADLRGNIHSDIFAFTGHAYLYVMDNNSTKRLRTLPIDEWKNNDYIYAVYDSERGVE